MPKQAGLTTELALARSWIAGEVPSSGKLQLLQICNDVTSGPGGGAPGEPP